MGAHGARFSESGLRERERRLLLRPDPGRGQRHPGQLRRDQAPDQRLLGHRHRHPGEVAGQGPVVRDPGQRSRSGRLGRRPAHLPEPAQADVAGVPA
ncbi:hypothetical protein G6F63_015091 [Rhizopus arrhizus]|nr:hypothetical protein G6F63_015091 [Rhizopus arrhizus]